MSRILWACLIAVVILVSAAIGTVVLFDRANLERIVPGLDAPERPESSTASAPPPSEETATTGAEWGASDTALLALAAVIVTIGGLYFGRRYLQMMQTANRKARKDARLVRVQFRSLDLLMRDDKLPTDFLKQRTEGEESDAAEEADTRRPFDDQQGRQRSVNEEIAQRLARLESAPKGTLDGRIKRNA